VDPVALRRALHWWPGAVEILSREEILTQTRKSALPSLTRYAEQSVFGLKFAAMVTIGAGQPALFVDSDILWFRDFTVGLEPLLSSTEAVVLFATTDFQRSYEEELLASAARTLNGPPYLNSGVVFLRGDLARHCDLEPVLRLIVRRGDAAGRLPFLGVAEQTLLALAMQEGTCLPGAMRAALWDPSIIACFGDDARTLGVTYRRQTWTARHYTSGVRHLFWRDALALRLGSRQLARSDAVVSASVQEMAAHRAVV
jgi:hypothetical protein